MNHLFSTFVIIAFISGLFGCSKLLSDTYSDKDKSRENRIAELEETIKRQEEKIMQLQSIVNEQQEEIEQEKSRGVIKEKYKLIERLLSKRTKDCRNVKVNSKGAKIYYCSDIVAAYFFAIPETIESTVGPDFKLFLEKMGLQSGTIEYFNSAGVRLFSISGTLSRAEIKKYH